jgi:hypothetical protein
MKRVSVFVDNLLKSKAITVEQAELLEELPSAHLQYEAVMLWRKSPGSDLEGIVVALKEGRHPEGHERLTAEPSPPISLDFTNLSRFFGLKTFAVIGAILLVMGIVRYRGLMSEPDHDGASSVEPTPASSQAPNKTPTQVPVRVSTPIAEAPRRPTRPSPPTNFRGSPPDQAGVITLVWDVQAASETYKLYSASRENLSDAKLEERNPITANRFHWMPTDTTRTVYLAVTRTLPGSLESRFSRPFRVEASSPTEPAEPAVSVAPATTP